MTALLYIIRKSMKNSLKELVKKPGKLILYLLVIAMIIGMIFLSVFTRNNVEHVQPLFWFSGILFAFVTMFFIPSVLKGLESGSAIFEMNDVNLLFVSPVSSRRILLYGIIRLTKTAFLAGFFILFQSSSLANFGINYGGVLLTLLGFMLSVIVFSVASLLIYSVTNGNPARKRIVRIVLILIFLPLAVFFGIQLLNGQDMVASLEVVIRSPFMSFIPVAGWTSAGVTAFLTGNLLQGFLFFGANFALGAGMVIYILCSNPDYYEDALVATETAFEKKRAVAEGNIGAASDSRKNVKLTKTGISGFGAAAIFGKHIRESFRQNRFGFLTMSSVFFIVGGAALSFFVHDLFIILQILMWSQIFLIGTGRGLKETYSHYIYLIPESSFKKILWSNMEVMARTLIEGTLIFGIGGIIVKENILYILAAALTYIFFSLLLLGVNYLFMRFTGADISIGILITIYYISVVLAMLPGAVPAIIIGTLIGGNAGLLIGLFILSGWELIAGLVCFALSKGVLHNCDMPTVKPRG